MNLTFEVKGNGYTILNDGVIWIKQDGFFPYKGETLEESAQLHINAIIEDLNKPTEEEEKLTALEERVALSEELLMEIMLNGVNA